VGYLIRILEVDFKEILRVPGSKDQQLLELVMPHVIGFGEAEEPWNTELYGDAPLATPSEALRQIINGDVAQAESGGGPYYEAVAALYMHFATSGDEIGLSSHETDHIDEVEEALLAAGAKPPLSLVDLLSRGVPFRLPQYDEGYRLGYLTPDEVVAASRQFEALSFDAVPEGPRETIEVLGLLLKDAASRNHALVGEYA